MAFNTKALPHFNTFRELCPHKCRWLSKCICSFMKFLKGLPRGWQPPHCPNPKCKFHMPLQESFPFKADGFYLRKSDNRRIQRYLCLACNRSFSTQTFSTTYWMKMPNLIKDIFMKTNGGMANRQISRDLQVNPGTVDRTLARMGRHSLLFHINQLQKAPPPEEIVVDGFVTFEHSQYFPFHHHNAVEKNSDFFIYFTDSEVRRSGSMTSEQKLKRMELESQYGKPDSQAVRKDMTHLLQFTLNGQTSAIVHSDAHKSYPRAIRDTDCDITHVVTPGKNHRDKHNNLWSINLLDRVTRHTCSNHQRETLAWSKRRQMSSYRMGIFLIWRNYVKVRREKNPTGPSPAMERGMFDHRLTVEEIFSERIFRDHTELPQRWAEYYDQMVVTRALRRNRTHNQIYAR